MPRLVGRTVIRVYVPLLALVFASAPAHAQAPDASQKRGKDDSGGVIRLGPVLGLGLPNLFSLGGLLKITDYLGAGVNMGIIPSVRISFYGEAIVSYNEYDIYGRIFPFGGGFFIGAGAGYATVEGTLKKTFDTSSYSSLLPPGISIPDQVTYESRGSVETLVFTPQIGYFHTTRIGFSIGIDFGAQIPIAPSDISYRSSTTLPSDTPQVIVDEVRSQYVEPIDQDVEDTLHTVGRTPLPSVNLRIGWLL